MSTLAIENNASRVAELEAMVARNNRSRQPDLPPLPDRVPGATSTTTNAILPVPPSSKADQFMEAGKAEHELPSIQDTVDFLATPPEHLKVLIEGVLYQGSKMIIGSGSKSFKTWTLLDLAMSVACGAPWLGIKTTPGRVLFLNFELKETSIQSRMDAIRTARCLQWESGKFDVWNLRGYAAEYSTIIPKILERVKAKGYDLIVLDPVYKLYGDTDENSAGDVAKLMNELEKLAVKTKAAIVFSAHFSKGNQAGKESVDRVSGSGVFARDPDSILNLTKHQQENAFVVESTLRDFKQLEPFAVKWEFPLLKRDQKLNPAQLKSPLTKKAKHTVRDLLKWVSQDSITTKTLLDHALEETGMSPSLFYKLSLALKKEPGVTFKEETKEWSYNPPPQAATE